MKKDKDNNLCPRMREILGKALFDMDEMVKVLYDERTTWFQGESSNKKKGDGSNGSKPPPPPPPSPPSLPPSSLPSHRTTPLTSPNGHAKSPLLKLDVKFELPMYNGEVNIEKLDNWVHQIKVYCRIQMIYDDVINI